MVPADHMAKPTRATSALTRDEKVALIRARFAIGNRILCEAATNEPLVTSIEFRVTASSTMGSLRGNRANAVDPAVRLDLPTWT
jgi:hypothetical protein